MVVAARQESERILQESQAAALDRTQEADRYAMSVLQDLAYRLANVSSQVQNGVELLSENMQNGAVVTGDDRYAIEEPSRNNDLAEHLAKQRGVPDASHPDDRASQYTQPQQPISETTYDTYQ